MNLERLKLENFRQFKGEQTMVLSDLRERNITVVHAENGFGKTTLLNAFRWALYGNEGLTADFEHPDRLITESVEANASDPTQTAVSVELTFKHGTDRYVITRRLTLAEQRIDASKPALSMMVMRDGQSFREAAPQNKINTIVPVGIANFLFFNGENIDHLAMEESEQHVSEAIQQMLGLKLLQTSIADLKSPQVRGKFVAELREKTTEEKQKLIDELSKTESDLQKLGERKEQEHRNVKSLAGEITAIDAKLEANREASELQKRRSRLLEEIKELAAKKEELTKQLGKLVAEDGHIILAQGLVSRGRAVVNRLRSEGKIPARVLDTFLHELLEKERCICTRCLSPGTPERLAVEQLLNVANDLEFNKAVGLLEHVIGLIEGAATKTAEQLKSFNRERLSLGQDIRVREEECEEIHQKLGSKKDNEVQELEDQRRRHELSKDAHQKEIGRLEAEIGTKTQRKTELDKSISLLREGEEQAALAQRRKDAVDACIQILENILAAEISELRPYLDEEINRHFKGVIDREYRAHLTNNFTVSVKKKVSGVSGEMELDVAKNQAMRQTLSLAFIGSLVSLAGKRAEIPTLVKGLSGAVYPIVMDSPFGTLDPLHRKGVAQMIPDLANQVVAFISSSQYEGAVAASFKSSGKVGKRYCLVYHGGTPPEHASRELQIEGASVQLYYPNTSEHVEIKELHL